MTLLTDAIRHSGEVPGLILALALLIVGSALLYDYVAGRRKNGRR